MDDSTSKNSCAIQRVGKIIKLEDQTVIMLINGKQIEVPLTKIAGEIVPGDLVVWSGKSWSRKSDIV
ncbi:hypothetical protein [Bacillus sp. FJAT-26390]|uniref:hypothetical protein n=1 Tax=Bacillus sp. FJAT-26390 TaxID=1743142 RepID=UPI0008080247|nr:hypothetical protein [Bacillus sp. FJAT-26390]OBZ17354.1 hypothetical protein A7975_05630 [Bacillus sp. FJAT-26390]